MFRKLSILQKKLNVNDFVLTKVWNELCASDAPIVAERLLSLRFFQTEGGGFSESLNDLALDFCVHETKKGDTFRANAVSFLSAYISPIDSLKVLRDSMSTMSNDIEQNIQEQTTQSHAQLLNLHQNFKCGDTAISANYSWNNYGTVSATRTAVLAR